MHLVSNSMANGEMQSMREQIFPSKGKNAMVQENVESGTLPKESKKGSVSSMKGKAKKSKAVAKKDVTPPEKSKQNSSKPETSKQIVLNKTSDGDTIRTRSKSKLSMQESVVMPSPVGSSDNNDSQVPKVRAKKNGHIGGKKDSDSTKHQRLFGTEERTLEFTEDLNHPPPPRVFGLSIESGLKFGNLPSQRDIGSSSAGNTTFGRPVWLSLVASKNV
ncbi:hypothetical protein RIF29_21613 [Crotalaria pallida]|uniref:Uncharacterized protein n=1 Tax=Crotalaria pallida TaxID=3830 RepID=A0AAN9F3B4_CROPI